MSYHFHLHGVFQFFYSIPVAGESCNFSNLLPGSTSQFYPCTHHESIFRIHNFCSECMHSELANLAGESITFLTISYFSVEKNSNSVVGCSNQHHPFGHPFWFFNFIPKEISFSSFDHYSFMNCCQHSYIFFCFFFPSKLETTTVHFS